ncbi:MAG: hypothetical protein V7632_3363 [Bradyrhizobium sp.]|jgi:hypothetical protein
MPSDSSAEARMQGPAAPAHAPRASVWQRLAGPFKEFGPGAGTLYVVDRLLRSISPRLGLYAYELMVQPIAPTPLLPPNLTRNLRFLEIDCGHADLALMPARDEIKAARFEQGARCLGVYRKDKLIGYLWFSFRRYHEDEVRCTYELAVAERSVFDFDVYVMPENRMGIGFAAVWHGANAFLAQRGVGYTFSRVTRFNLASRRAHAHLGGRCVGRAMFFKAGIFELMFASIRPYLSVSWSRNHRVRLRLAPDVLQTAGKPAPH